MKVIILAAGYGTRLASIAANTPKPLLPINDRPLIDYIIDRVKDLPSLNEIVVITNNKFVTNFQDWAKKSKLKTKITVVNDGTNTPEERLGSIGDIDFAIKKEKINDDVIVVGGDNLFDFDIAAYGKFAQSKGDHCSIGVYDIHNIEEAKLFGVVLTDKNDKIVSFEEKPAQPKTSVVAMCFYYFPKKTLNLVGEYLKSTDKSDRAGDYIKWLCEKFGAYGFKFTGKWYDIGSVEAYHEAQKNFK